MNRARITYRFDHNDHRNNHAPAINSEPDEQTTEPNPNHTALNSFTSEYRSWSSPIDSEVQRLEELIRSTDQVPKREVQQETVDKPVDYEQWGGLVDDSYVSYRRSSNRVPWFKMIFTVSGAILTGIMLGMFVLSLFNQNPEVNLPATNQGDDVTLPTADLPDTVQSILEGNTALTDTQNTKQLSFALPAQIFQVLQVGVFGTSDAADKAALDLHQQGLAAAIEQAGQYHVYAGVSSNRDDVLGLKKELENRELETYIKTYELPVMNQIIWKGTSENIPVAYFTNINQLIRSISAVTLLHLQEQTPTAIMDNTLDSILAEHKEMMLVAVQTAGGFSGEVSSSLQSLNNEMNTAVDALTAYGKNPSRAYLWQAQSAIMQVLLLEKHALATAGST